MVSSFEITTVDLKALRVEVLPRKVQKAFQNIILFDFLPCDDWYLAGGTALALQTGHRKSFDLDFFTPRVSFHEDVLERSLFATGAWNTTFRDKGTIYGEFIDIKVSFIAYPFFHPSPQRVRCGNVCVLAPHDIAPMKIIAISQRGRKRDFVDLYWYCLNRESLAEIVQRAVHQYPGQQHNLHHFLKSLSYFADADEDPMPEIFFDASWETIKAYFQKEVPCITKELLHLDEQ